ncbi:probable glutamate receptor [Lutzomyia longipalpis]|uniref:probable glutamate receptor n=1 Tax=Lutzomyia longipalpis TaxID=7200 RepID=UPI002484149D|nr:probable glutamate receptor [Lutzomyia longipalpis]
MNLHGNPLTASIVITNNDTYSHLADYRNRHIDSITKVNWVLTNYIFDIVNATRQFRYQPGWGIKNKSSGHWDGMVGDLLDDRADLGGTSLFMTAERVPIIDYISMTVPTHAAFIFRPPPLSYISNIFYLPYQDMVWVCALILFGVCTVIFFIVWRASLKMQEHCDPKDVPRFTDVLMNAMGAVTQQGEQMDAKVLPGRIASFSLSLAMLFLYASYTANIVALLQSTTNSISTLQHLLDSKLNFGVEDIVYNRYYFSTATEPVRKALYEKKIAPRGKKDKFIEKNLGVAKMREGLFAFHVEVSGAYKLVEETFYEHEKCGLMEIKFLQVIDPWYAIRKHSPYKEMVKVSLFKIREHGIQEREVGKIYSKKPECATRGSNFDSVRLIDCHVIIIIILSGYAISIFVFLLEKLVNIRQCAISTAIFTL